MKRRTGDCRPARVQGYLLIEPSSAHPHDILVATLRFPPTGQFPQFLQTMISVSNVSMRYGAKVLFDDVSTGFAPGKRFGLTGPNGAGKSTFMKLLTGELEPQKGNIVRPRKLGVLSQDQFAFDPYRVIDAVIMGNKRLWAALEEREKLYSKAEMTDADGMRLGELEGIVGEENGYTAESDAAILLQGLDIPDELHERQMGELAGGQKVRVLLAQALLSTLADLQVKAYENRVRERLIAKFPTATPAEAGRLEKEIEKLVQIYAQGRILLKGVPSDGIRPKSRTAGDVPVKRRMPIFR